MEVLELKANGNIEGKHFNDFIDLCFEISNYFSFTIRNFHDQEEKYKKFLQELQAYFYKKIKTVHWFCYGVKKHQPLEIYIYKANNEAKSVIKKYYDNLFLEDAINKNLRNMPEDLCFYYKNKVVIGTVSHEYICWLFSPNEQIKKRFQKICSWKELDCNEGNKFEQVRIDGNNHLAMDSLYFQLKLIQAVPKRFLGEKSLVALYYYIKGYYDGASDESYEYDGSNSYSDFLSKWDFSEFVYSYYNDAIASESENWYKVIMNHTNSQEQAFDKFYELLDEFVKKNELE